MLRKPGAITFINEWLLFYYMYTCIDKTLAIANIIILHVKFIFDFT